jgi:hypothetical protein
LLGTRFVVADVVDYLSSGAFEAVFLFVLLLLLESVFRRRTVAHVILVGLLGIFTAILWQMVGDPSSAIQFAIMTIVYFVFVFRLGLLATAVLGGCINLLGMFAPDPLLDWWWGQSALLPMGVIATFAIVGCVIATGPERRMLRTANRTSATIR